MEGKSRTRYRRREIAGLVRLPNLILIALFFTLGDQFILEPIRGLMHLNSSLTRLDFHLFTANVLLITLVGYWINDLADEAIDSINRPERALPSGWISRRALTQATIVLFVLGWMICFYLGWKYDKMWWTTLYPATALLLLGYARYGKKSGFLGNILVSGLIAALPGLLILTELEAWKAFTLEYPSHYDQFSEVFWYYFWLIFFINLGREVVKDIEDEQGDRSMGGKSLVILLGRKRTTVLAVVLILGTLAIQWMFLKSVAMDALILAIGAGVSLLLFWSIWKLGTTSSEHVDRGASKILKWIMFLGMMEMLLFARLV